jgi:hypothetical protein
MPVSCECCVLPGRNLRDGPIPFLEDSYRLWCVIVCDLEAALARVVLLHQKGGKSTLADALVPVYLFQSVVNFRFKTNRKSCVVATCFNYFMYHVRSSSLSIQSCVTVQQETTVVKI